VLKMMKASTISGEGERLLVMRIPRESMITTELAIQLIIPWWPSVVDFVNGTPTQRWTNLFSPKDDVLLALSLAFIAASKPSSSREDRLARAYVSTLPDSSSYWDSLPRRWSVPDLEARLEGSPLLERAHLARAGLESDFRLVKEMFAASVDGIRVEFPVIFDTFSDMLAAVSSRAFVLDEGMLVTDATKYGEAQQRVALVPVLDLCDHCRGESGDNARTQKKNLSYTFDGNCMVVESSPLTTSFPAGETLRLTYGAKGNAQLLLNYGFTIPNNLEPDGSSNDVLEFKVSNAHDTKDANIVLLRTGDKSYTFGCLRKALACFGTEQQDPIAENDNETADHDSDMEAFLNGVDDEDEDFDVYELRGNGVIRSEVVAPECDDSRVDAIVESLSAFCQAIHGALGRYQPDEIVDNRLAAGRQTSDYFAALLIQSEKRTLNFYLLAARKITAILQAEPLPAACSKSFKNKDDRDLVEVQTSSLADTFLSIRCPDAIPGKGDIVL
jgi:hypothetical protein